MDLQEESTPVPRVSKPSAAPYQSGLLMQILDSQRVPVRPEDEDMELGDEPEPESEQEFDERDPDYVPRRGDEANADDTSDDEVPRDQPRQGKGKSDLRGKVTRAPRARQCPAAFKGSAAPLQRGSDPTYTERGRCERASPNDESGLPTAGAGHDGSQRPSLPDLHLPKHGLSR